MGRDLTAALKEWIEEGFREIGQIRIAIEGEGFTLRHVADERLADLERFEGSAAARELARVDAEGEFRPLKTAPNLRRGWILRLADVAELRLALDYFYPAALGLNRAHLAGELRPVDLRRTLERQTGMYAVTRRISDEEADAMLGRCCNPETGCLRSILWRIDEGRPVTSVPGTQSAGNPRSPVSKRMPLLCIEVCNLVVAEARRVVKGRGRE